MLSNVQHALLKRRLAICLVVGDKWSVVVAEPADGFPREMQAEVLDVVSNPAGLVVAPEGGIAAHKFSEFAPEEEVVRRGLDHLSRELLGKGHAGGSSRRGRSNRSRRPPLASTEDGGRRGADSRWGDGIVGVGLVGISACLGLLVIEEVLLGHALGLGRGRPCNGISSFGIVGVDESPDLIGVHARHSRHGGWYCWWRLLGDDDRFPGQGTMRVSELAIGDQRRCKSPIVTMGGQDNGRTRAELWTRRVSMMGKVLIFWGQDQVVKGGIDGGGVGLTIDAMTGRVVVSSTG